MIPYAVDTWTAACVHMLLGMCTHVTNASYTCLLTHAIWHVYTRHFSCVHMIFYACVHMLCMHVYTCVCACVHMIDFEHVYTWFPACVHMRSWHMLFADTCCMSMYTHAICMCTHAPFACVSNSMCTAQFPLWCDIVFTCKSFRINNSIIYLVKINGDHD